MTTTSIDEDGGDSDTTSMAAPAAPPPPTTEVPGDDHDLRTHTSATTSQPDLPVEQQQPRRPQHESTVIATSAPTTLLTSDPKTVRDRILNQRSSHEVARDTKRILEICYGGGNASEYDVDPPSRKEQGEPVTATTKKKKKHKTKTSTMKRCSTGKKQKSKTMNDAQEQSSDESDGGSSEAETPDGVPMKKRKKMVKKRDKTTSDNTDEGDEEEPSSSSTKKKTKKKKKKKKKSSNGKRTKIKRDAAGRIIRRRRKIKDRHKVVKKEFIKKGKDAKINLPTIVDDEDEYYSESDDEDEDWASSDGSHSDMSDDNDSDSDSDDEHDKYVDDENEAPGTDHYSNKRLKSDDNAKTLERDIGINTDDAEDNVIKNTTVASLGSSNTENTDDDRGASRKFPHASFSYQRRKGLCLAVLVSLAVAVVVIVVLLFVVDEDEEKTDDIAKTGSTSPSTPPSTFSPTSESPTSSPTSFFFEVSTTCQTLAGRPGVKVFEAEDSFRLGGDVIIDSDISGYCGRGYVTNFVDQQSRLFIADVDVEITGIYSFVLRYSTNNDEDDIRQEEDVLFRDPRMILDVGESSVGSFNLISTGNSTTWMADEITDVLLKNGTHRLVLWVNQESAWSDPNVDWLAVHFQREATRFEYLSSLLSPIFSDLSEPSPTQIQALVWLSSDDLSDWSVFDDDEIIERYILALFYFSTNGDLWSNNNEWLSAIHVCSWYGILCWEGKRVTDLFLGTFRIDSYAHLALLHVTVRCNLRSFQNHHPIRYVADDNSLFGTLPFPEIGHLSRLVSISASYNSIEGTIGSNIGNLIRLERLLLDANFLSSSLPPSFGNLTSLTYLSLESNELTGTIPSGIFSLSNLEFFSIATNNINGTVSSGQIGDLLSITELNLSNNQVSGTIPTELGVLTTLTSLSLASNDFTGTVPSELGMLTDLILLDVNSNDLTGMWPPELDLLLNDTVIDYCTYKS